MKSSNPHAFNVLKDFLTCWNWIEPRKTDINKFFVFWWRHYPTLRSAMHLLVSLCTVISPASRRGFLASAKVTRYPIQRPRSSWVAALAFKSERGCVLGELSCTAGDCWNLCLFHLNLSIYTANVYRDWPECDRENSLGQRSHDVSHRAPGSICLMALKFISRS